MLVTLGTCNTIGNTKFVLSIKDFELRLLWDKSPCLVKITQNVKFGENYTTVKREAACQL